MDARLRDRGWSATAFASDDLPYLKNVQKHAESLGIRFTCLATYNDFAYVKDENWRLANIAFVKKWLQIAADLGVANIRMLTGYYVPGEDRARLEKLTLDGIAECIPVAERCKVNMAIENHNSIFFEADDILTLIRRFGSKRLTTCPDPSNWAARSFFSPECTPAERKHVFDSAAKLAPLATEAHLKVKGITPDGKLMGWGDDLAKLISIYRKAGYDGVVAFESIVDGDLLAPMAQALAAQGARDAAWAQSILRLTTTKAEFQSMFEPETLQTLIMLLSPQQVQAIAQSSIKSFLNELKDDSPLLSFLQVYCRPWTPDLARTVIQSAQHQAGKGWRLAHALPEFAKYVPSELMEELARGWPNETSALWNAKIDEFLMILKFRNEIRRSLEEQP